MASEARAPTIIIFRVSLANPPGASKISWSPFAFRDARRCCAPMNCLFEYQTEAHVEKIAAYLLALQPAGEVPAVTDVSDTSRAMTPQEIDAAAGYYTEHP
jgi:hypothetical protein